MNLTPVRPAVMSRSSEDLSVSERQGCESVSRHSSNQRLFGIVKES